MSKFRLTEVQDDDKWDEFVRVSPQGSIFSLSSYLKYAVDHYRKFWVLKGNQIKAGLTLVLNDKERECILDDFVIHNGLIFSKDDSRKEIKAKRERFEISEFVINWLDRKYSKIELSLSPQFEDMRPFIWHNYNSKNSNDHFGINLRYTSGLDISELFLKKMDEKNDLFIEMDSKIQTDIQRATKAGLKFMKNSKTDDVIRLYNETMSSKGINIDENKLSKLTRLIDGLNSENLIRIFSVEKENGSLTYITVFTIHNNISYYLFGAGNPKLMERYDGTFCIWNSFMELSNLGIYFVDMEGVNSPNRGEFKLGFGGSLNPYFHVYKYS